MYPASSATCGALRGRLEYASEACVGFVEIEARRIEVLAEPFERVLVRFVRWVAIDGEPVVVAINAAHVVIGGGGFTGNALWNVILIAAGRAFFQLNDMFPRIAEVVFVDDLFALRR